MLFRCPLWLRRYRRPHPCFRRLQRKLRRRRFQQHNLPSRMLHKPLPFLRLRLRQ